MVEFDDSRLEDRTDLGNADTILRRLAQAGSRMRIEGEAARHPVASLDPIQRPRAVIAVGSEARLIRALLEPVCPVPFLAWPSHGLPGWVGALDLVVILASAGGDHALQATVHEAVRRGVQLIIAAPAGSPIVDQAASRSTTVLDTTTSDPLAAAVVALSALHRMELGPDVDIDAVAAVLDTVAEDCSPYVDLSANPAKELALGLADAQALVWGGSVLAARASRRIAEALRAASSRPALAADAHALQPILDHTSPGDLFADPFDHEITDRRPCLIVLDDGYGDDHIVVERRQLTGAADRADVRVCTIAHSHGTQIERYCSILQTGLFGAAYLAIGLGRYAS